MSTSIVETEVERPEPPPQQAALRQRIVALDVFRGMTVAGMLLVNNPGSWGAIYPPLEHAEWHGWTPTDLIFPFFLFVVGITTHLSLSARREAGADEKALLRQIFRRGAIIILLGLFLNSFPFFMWGSIDGNPDPSFMERVARRFEYLRYLGVLQRIGIVYIAAALLTLKTTLRQQLVIISALLLGYWAVMTLVTVPGTASPGAVFLDQPERTMAAYVDRLLLGEKHTWRATKSWDPEGPLSTIPAIATAMLGTLAGFWIRSGRKGVRPLPETIAGLFAAGAMGMVAGLVWNWIFPINKNLWTSSYVLFTAGMAVTAIATCMWLIDERGIRWWTKPFVIYGVNPIVAFAGSGLMARLTDSLIRVPFEGKSTTLHMVVYKTFFVSLPPPIDARDTSLLYAIAFVLFWYVILWLLYRKNIIIKV